MENVVDVLLSWYQHRALGVYTGVARREVHEKKSYAVYKFLDAFSHFVLPFYGW